MVGALTLYNITPGPLLFEQQPDLVWGLIASMFIGNVMLLVMNIPMVGLFARMLYVPHWILVPGIAAISFVGVYAVHATTFDLVLMIGPRRLRLRCCASSASRWRRSSWGSCSGDMMEQNLRRALAISDGNLGILFESPMSPGSSGSRRAGPRRAPGHAAARAPHLRRPRRRGYDCRLALSRAP